MLDAEEFLLPAELPVLSLKIGVPQIQHPVADIVTGRAAHGKKRFAADIVYLSAHQMKHVGPDDLHPAAVPLCCRIGGQQVEVFVIAIQKQRRKRQVIQSVQPRLLLGAIVPDAAEIAADDDAISPGHTLLRGESPFGKAGEVPVCVAGNVDHFIFPLAFSWYIQHTALRTPDFPQKLQGRCRRNQKA